MSSPAILLRTLCHTHQHGPAAQVDLGARREEQEAAALGPAQHRDDGRHDDQCKHGRHWACRMTDTLSAHPPVDCSERAMPALREQCFRNKGSTFSLGVEASTFQSPKVMLRYLKKKKLLMQGVRPPRARAYSMLKVPNDRHSPISYAPKTTHCQLSRPIPVVL